MGFRIHVASHFSNLLIALYVLSGCSEQNVQFATRELTVIFSLSPLPEVPPDPTNRFSDSLQAAAFGRALFFDPRLSANGKIACATCHEPARQFSDGKRIAMGMAPGTRRTPSILNSGFNRWFFWDGRADSLWSQSLKPLENSSEHGSSRLELVHLIDEDSRLREGYQKIFGPLPSFRNRRRFPNRAMPIGDSTSQLAWRSMSWRDQQLVDRTFANLGKALGAFERSLRTGHTPFDDFVAGLKEQDPTRISKLSISAQRGLRLFLGDAQCVLCHFGPNFSDGEFHNLGLPGSPATDLGRWRGVDQVRADPFSAIGAFSDYRTSDNAAELTHLLRTRDNLGQFKTPSLRNVAFRAPYMHDGELSSLQEVIRFYSVLDGEAVQGRREGSLLPLHLSTQQTEDLVAFLESLSSKE